MFIKIININKRNELGIEDKNDNLLTYNLHFSASTYYLS